jgi:hypothetical protein
MSRKATPFLIVSLLGWLSCAAPADVVGLASTIPCAATPPEGAPCLVQPLVPAGDAPLDDMNWLLRGRGDCQPGPREQQPSAALPMSGGVVRELPAAPSSLALVASAFAGLGVYHGLRSLRKLQFNVGTLPDWYHTGGPAQVGHATPFDLEFGALPVCAFDEPGARPVFAYCVACEPRSRLRSQFFLLVESPRAPPAQA